MFHERKYACESCQKLCFSSTELRNHYCRKLPKEKRKVLKCTACPKMFFTEMGLRKHKKNHLSDGLSTTYICSECSETFSSKLIYQRHVHTIHSKSRQYECKICDKVFYRGDALKMHLTNIHMQGKAEVNYFTLKVCIIFPFNNLCNFRAFIVRVATGNLKVTNTCKTT